MTAKELKQLQEANERGLSFITLSVFFWFTGFVLGVVCGVNL